MENLRNIETILSPENFNWVGNGFYTTSFVGGKVPRSRMDPFFAVGYNAEIEFTAKAIPRGVGAHPHKGFETVTLAYKGKIEHKDSRGNHGVIAEGDVQWMTAGSGVLHQEYHEEGYSMQGGAFQMVQLWVNLPAKDKEVDPQYQELQYTQMPKVAIGENGSFVHVVAGAYDGTKGAATTFSPMHVYNAYLQPGDNMSVQLPRDYNTAILVIDGSIKVNEDTNVEKDRFVLFENGGSDTFTIQAQEADTKVLVLSGEPLNEPVVHYGPFVMNTEAQIHQAIKDFQAGKFGTL